MKLPPSFRRALGAFTFLLAGGAPVSADVVLDWNDLLSRVVAENSTAAPSHVRARTWAMTHLAIDAAVAAAADAPLRSALERGAVGTAACAVLETLLPPGKQSFHELAARQLAAVEAVHHSHAKRLGHLAAAQVLQRRERDGWMALATLAAGGAIAPDASMAAAHAVARREPPPRSAWLSLTPFVLKHAGHLKARPAYEVNHLGEVMVDHALRHSRLFSSVDRTLPGDALVAAWAEEPLSRWNRVARAALASARADAATEARVLAVLNLALSDALIAAQHSRFTLGTWRAIEVERWEELDGRGVLPGEPTMTATDGFVTRTVRQINGRMLVPPQRDFPSLAATLAGAAQAALAACWKTDRVAFGCVAPGTTPDGNGGLARSYTSFSDAAREAAFVASLDGRHSREACVSGYELGRAIGAYVAKHAPAARR